MSVPFVVTGSQDSNISGSIRQLTLMLGHSLVIYVVLKVEKRKTEVSSYLGCTEHKQHRCRPDMILWIFIES